MATISEDYAFTLQASPDQPVAVVAPTAQDTVVGAVVRLDGRSSFSPSGLDLTYAWSFKQVPIGSQVAADGFKSLEDDDSVVSFAPDVIGLYIIQLVVNDGSFDSEPVESEVNTKVVLVPQNLGIIPDLSWIWNFLSDFWTRVEQRQRFETFWSSAVQIVAAEQLKLWQYDYNKSIQDIQELIQKRWVKYEPALSLNIAQTSFILAEDQAGLNASTYLIDPVSNSPQVNQPLLSNLVTVPTQEGSFSVAPYGGVISSGRLLQLDELSFTMSRSGVATRSVDMGADGAVSPATNTFLGSAFSIGMVGMALKILSGPAKGMYTIISVTDASHLQVKNEDGSATSFPSSPSGLGYSIFPVATNYNSFFADENAVPTRQSPLPWRFSSTLVSEQYDFEAQGVSTGDVLVMQITRTDNRRSSVVNTQVVSVDRNRIGFVFNVSDLVVGTPSRELSRDDQIQVANDLQVPGLMVSLTDNSLVYTDQALLVKTTVQSPAFKRKFFETELSPTSEINIGPFSVSVSPLRVIRNSKVLVDSNVKSIPSLQEYVKQPELVEQNGSLFQISEGKLYPLARRPSIVHENTDYIVDNETGVSGTCAVLANNDHIVVPFGDLLDRGIGQGDAIEITEDTDVFTFRVMSVIDGQTIRVAPTPTFTDAAVQFRVKREVEGVFVRFVEGVFTKTAPAPARLWAEVTFFDNNDAVENNFGVLVGVLRSDLSSVGATISYRNAVAGLMYALTNGPTVANLQLASQILLGLPFTTSAGTVIEIDPSFKTNPDGSPLVGRILIAAENSRGKPLGITNIYFYPQGRQIPDPSDPTKWVPADPELSGLAINPATGQEYKVGDHVDRFAALSKGTQVQDYLTTPGLLQQAISQGNSAFAIQQYHSFQLIVNADITTAIDTDLVAQFIKKAKPTYVKLALALSKALEDIVTVDDSINFRRGLFMDDNESLSLPVSASLDPQNIDAAFVTTEGEMWSYRISGSDLVTTQSSLQVSSASGGFITPRPFESHDGDFIRAGHLVQIFGGPNQGMYLVSAVNSDTQITLQSTDEEGDSFVFQTLTGQSFAVYMPISPRVISGSCSLPNGATSTVPSFGIGSPGVAVGDLMVYYGGGVFSVIHKITGVNPQTGTITFQPAVSEASGTRTVVIFREGLSTQHFGYAPTATPLTIDAVSTSKTLSINVATADPAIPLLAFPGDIIVNPTTSEEFVVIDVDPVGQKIYVQPPAANTGTYAVRLERQSRSDTIISADVLDRIPGDSLYLAPRRRSIGSGGSGPDLTTTNGSPTVSTVSGIDFGVDLGVVASDYLIVLEGADSTRNIGYGAGVFPIIEVQTTSLLLSRPLTVTNASPGILYGIQRRSSNER